ncbi:MAG: hypothetical protein IPK16_30875 [Anaerolineales bacterium]|nr:hypothetical protein [Anaerolineales bacterium]
MQSITGPEGVVPQLHLRHSPVAADFGHRRLRPDDPLHLHDGLYRLTNLTSPKGHDSMQLSYTPDNRVKKQTLGATNPTPLATMTGRGSSP